MSGTGMRTTDDKRLSHCDWFLVLKDMLLSIDIKEINKQCNLCTRSFYTTNIWRIHQEN